MPKEIDPNQLVFLEEIAISNMFEIVALVDLLEQKGILTKQELFDAIHEARRRTPSPGQSA
jgi:hypothetical protein